MSQTYEEIMEEEWKSREKYYASMGIILWVVGRMMTDYFEAEDKHQKVIDDPEWIFEELIGGVHKSIKAFQESRLILSNALYSIKKKNA